MHVRTSLLGGILGGQEESISLEHQAPFGRPAMIRGKNNMANRYGKDTKHHYNH
jgi:hypothetical protein